MYMEKNIHVYRLPLLSNRRLYMKRFIASLILFIFTVSTSGYTERAVSINKCASDSDLVIVGTITAIAYSAVTVGNDDMYVSDATVVINETLKGSAVSPVTVRILGGTIAGVTMRNSSFPYAVWIGQRAVFFLSTVSAGRRTLMHQGYGFYELKSDDTVQDQRGLTLAIIRQQVS